MFDGHISVDKDMWTATLSNVFLQPVVSSVPRPIPELPKAEESRGLPQKREELVKNQAQKEERSDSSKSSASSSVSSSKEEYPNIDLETPRVSSLLVFTSTFVKSLSGYVLLKNYCPIIQNNKCYPFHF